MPTTKLTCFDNLNAWHQHRTQMDTSLTLGFVPTMGNLHEGHLSLCQQSQRENDLTIMSIFVNPTQFNQQADYTHYPRTLEADLEQLTQAGVNYCLLPTEAALYPNGYRYRVEEHEVALTLEGKHRPGHYTGVLTVVMKLLNVVQPHRAYFGEKDYQQYQLIKGMVHDFFLNINIQVCPTIREPSGLAYSSRNNRLSPLEKKQADTFARIFRQPDEPLETIRRQLEQANIQIEYLSAVSARRFAAIHIGQVRLIDNYAVQEKSPCEP